MTWSPYISVVMTTRNDDHGGGMTERMRHCFASLAAQAGRTHVPIELVIVEWNPPADRPLLVESGFFPPRHDWFRTRIITVPAAYHAALPNSDKLPLFQYLAKNIGIRRAEAPFVLGSNVDVILSLPLADWMAERRLEPGVLYRLDRWDVALADIDPKVSEVERQRLCESRVTKLNLSSSTLTRTELEVLAASGPLLSFDATAAAVEWFNSAEATQRSALTWHMNACGDFTLMSRDDWYRLRGHPEWPIHSWSIDSILLARAQTRGMRQCYLGPCLPAYHIDHDPGWGAKGFNNEGLSFTLRPDDSGAYRLSAAWHVLPQLTYVDTLRIHHMFQQDAEIEYNTTDGWGAIDTRFDEVVLP